MQGQKEQEEEEERVVKRQSLVGTRTQSQTHNGDGPASLYKWTLEVKRQWSADRPSPLECR